MSLSSMNLIGQTVFELESGNENVDRQTDGQTNKQTKLHQFRKEKKLIRMIVKMKESVNVDIKKLGSDEITGCYHLSSLCFSIC